RHYRLPMFTCDVFRAQCAEGLNADIGNLVQCGVQRDQLFSRHNLTTVQIIEVLPRTSAPVRNCAAGTKKCDCHICLLAAQCSSVSKILWSNRAMTADFDFDAS